MSARDDKPAPCWLTGQILIAMPAMGDARFAQSVIFMCAHSAEGAMGVVLNKPLKNQKFPELLRQLGVQPAPPLREIALGAGGPVDDTRGFVLHTADWASTASLDVDGTHLLTASLDVLQAIAEGGGPAKARLVLGYAGWGAGQLEEEILQNSWLTVPADDAIMFDAKNEAKWARALGKLKIDPAMLSGAAGHA
ncbi:YqgE/AlgH family protein [Acidocella sp.]|uniref:YqgE/AlgH family protein n=1 Tax=Acidocella sp. TaxID=50710 RepID=UPI0026193998|nr:YqgE/AlgH family protein [Acidocella sp.]